MQFPLSKQQQNILNLHRFYDNTAICSIGGTARFCLSDCPENIEALRQAVYRLLEDHEGLRLQLCSGQGEICQYVAAMPDSNFEILDYRALTSDQRYQEYTRLTHGAFSLFDSPLYEFYIVREPNEIALYCRLHHLIGDAWSLSLLCKYIGDYLHCKGEYTTSSYLDYISSEEHYLSSMRHQKDAAFWAQYFSEIPNAISLKPGISSNSCAASRLVMPLPLALCNELNAFCAAHHYTESVLFETAVLAYLLRINTDASSSCVGMPVINRRGIKEKQTLGNFVSTLPLRIDVQPDVTLETLIRSVAEQNSSVFRHAQYSYGDILAQLREKHPEAKSLFDVVVSYQSNMMEWDSTITTEWYDNGCCQYSMILSIDDRDQIGQYRLTIDYQNELFPHDGEINWFVKRLICILEQMLCKPEMKLCELSILSPAEQDILINQFNNTASTYPCNKTIAPLFAEQAARNPDKPAILFEGDTLSYYELDQISDSVAQALHIHPHDVVAYYGSRTPDILIAQLATLKNGGIFLPIDITNPKGRIQDILNDAAVALILTDQMSRAESLLQSDSTRIICIDQLKSIPACKYEDATVQPEDSAHIIYTSGSTGKPKGTLLTHRGLVNFLYHNGTCTPDNPCSTSVSINTVSFDMFLCETLVPLLCGATVILANENEQIDQEKFARLIEENEVDLLQTTPTRLKILMQDRAQLNYLKCFKKILFSGEPFLPEFYDDLRTLTDARIFNTCGPSENHIWICGHEQRSNDITLGYPIGNVQIYIFNEHMELMPIGVPGELCVSGDCIGNGYLNRPDLNAEKYVPHPFLPGQTLYKTGDLALMRPNGEIDHRGRIDTQIKLNGLRIELGEIESALNAIEGIGYAVACLMEADGKNALCGFYTGENTIDYTEAKRILMKVLPTYMLPQLLVHLPAFPMTSSGKVDRRALSHMDISAYAKPANMHQSPKTPLQEMLCELFSESLNVADVSTDADYFALGGNSISVLKMISHAPRELCLSPSMIYMHPTVLELEAALHENQDIRSAYTTLYAFREQGSSALICFPFAGGTHETFFMLDKALSGKNADISIYSLKHSRWDDDAFPLLLQEIKAISVKHQRMFFYSHCAGSACLLKVLQTLNDSDKVQQIFIAANLPPKGVGIYGRYATPWQFVSDSAIKKLLENSGLDFDGLDPDTTNDLLQRFRKDTKQYFSLMASLKKISVSKCSFILGECDWFTKHPQRTIKRWNKYISGEKETIIIPDANHYFHQHKASQLADIIDTRISQEMR